MQDDIRPSKSKKTPPNPAHQPMRSQRLRGHNLETAKDRLNPKPVARPAAAEEAPIVLAAAEPPAKQTPIKKQRFAWWRDLNRNLRFGIIALLLLLFATGAILFYNHNRPAGSSFISITRHKKAAAKTVASPLTGLQVDPALAARPVTGIMIENSDAARPQSGLQDAGVVYEAIAEGGVTRFLTLFQDASPQYIGPVRSLRPYYIDYAAPFQASIVHVGGSPDALAEVTDGSFRNLDQFANGDYFTRVNSRDAPHNVYTSFSEIDQLNQSKGYTSSSYTSWPRKADKKLATPTAKTIQLAIAGPDFYANYTYDAKTNTYLRSEGGAPHLDLVNASDTTGVQLSPKVVIAIVVPLSSGALDASGAYYSNYQTSGTGTAYVFQDGGVTQGSWTKGGTNDQISFSDASGAPLKLDAGQTWITLISGDNMVTYAP